MSFGNTLKKLRESRALTQLKLGEAVGVSEKVISKWENGDTEPSIEKLIAAADALSVNVDTLLERSHDMTGDIKRSLNLYMQSVAPENAAEAAQTLASYIVLGAEIREARDSKCYSDDTLNELAVEWERLITEGDERPQIWFFEPKADTLHDYQNGSMDVYISSDLMLTVFQSYRDDVFKGILDKYDQYRKLFEFLSLPDADELLLYRYSEAMPDYFTAEHLSDVSGASPETVAAFLDIGDCGKTAQTVILDGKKQLMYMKPVICGEQSALQTVISAAYAFAAKRKAGNR